MGSEKEKRMLRGKLVPALILLCLGQLGMAQQSCPTLGDDGFGYWLGNCCDTASPNLPSPSSFPTMEIAGQYAVIDNCQTVTNYDVDVTLQMFNHPGIPGGPQIGLPACDEFAFAVNVTSTPVSFSIGQIPVASDRTSFILAKFSRTWTIMDSNGQVRQYWRYVSSGDAKNFTGTGTSPNPIPPCWSNATPQPTHTWDGVCFWGSIELSCGLTGEEPPETDWRFSLSFTHYDGCLSHLATPLNDRQIPVVPGPAQKHLGTSYHLVAPNNFNWLAGQPTNPSAALLSTSSNLEAVRSTVSHSQEPGDPGPLCLFEWQSSHSSTEIGRVCGCDGDANGTTFTQQWDAEIFCNARPWSTVAWVPDIPTGFNQQYLGQWTSAARDDVANVLNYSVLGTLDFGDECDPRNPGDGWKHIVYGVDWIFPDDAIHPILFSSSGAAATDMLLDFGDSCNPGIPNNTPGVSDFPKVGSPEYTNILWMISR